MCNLFRRGIMNKVRVLFICDHNSARSKMAQALLNLLGSEHFEAESAGFELRPVNPLVIEVMREKGVDLANTTQQTVFEAYRGGHAYQYVILVCSRETDANCPIFPGVHNNRFRIVFPDPTGIPGTHEKKLHEVRKIRDEIQAEIERFISWIDTGNGGLPGPHWERD